MLGMIAIMAAAGWLLAFAVCAMVTALPPVRAGAAGPWPPPAGERPALVNLAVTRGRLNGAAYSATILDLAAKGHLVITQRMPGRLWCDVPAAAPPDAGLARSERLVLASARRQAGGGGAPFEAVAESCASDVSGTWIPFERAVRAEGRQAGITRSRLPVAMQVPLYAGAGAVSVLTFAVVQAAPHSGGLWTPLVVALIVAMLLVSWVGGFGQKDRLTGHGSATGAWAAREAAGVGAGWGQPGPVPASSPAELSALALAIAAGAAIQVPGARPGVAARVRPGHGRARADYSVQSAETPRPKVAWSSFGGQWRLVRIGSSTRMPPGLWLAVAAWLALLTYGASLLPSPYGQLLPALLVTGAIAASVAGVRGLAVWLARPTEASFRGQVIARWVERHGDNDSDRDVSCIAVDDGERSWSFEVSHIAFEKVALGDMVAVRASPRSGKLLALVAERDGADYGADRGPADHGAADHGAAAPGQPGVDLMDDGNPFQVTPGASDPLLTAEEVAAAVGRPVRATGWQIGVTGAIYRGADLTVTLTVVERALGGLSARMARRLGRELPGIGDEAWLLERDRTVVFRVGTHTGKVTITGAAAPTLPPDVLTELAAAFAGRLAAAVTNREPSGTPPPGTLG